MDSIDDDIKRFLSISSGDGSGDGYGDGSGDGYGDGSGSGDGYGSGYGSGYGDGDGDGDGDGYGDGFKTFNRQKVYLIDFMPTLVHSVKGNYAVGAIVNKDNTTTDCYIAKVGNFFSHGETLHDAMQSAKAKYDRNKPLGERIADFKSKYPNLDTVVDNAELFVAHHTLTDSCLMGRRQFAKENDIDVENGSMTVREFINLTRNAYGSDAILQLEQAYLK